MSTQNKKINHDFNIGDSVFVLKDYAIIPCVIIGISASPLYKESINIINGIDKNSITYELIKLQRKRNKNNQTVFSVSISDYDRYSYHSSKVYDNVDDLLSDLRNSIEKSS